MSFSDHWYCRPDRGSCNTLIQTTNSIPKASVHLEATHLNVTPAPTETPSYTHSNIPDSSSTPLAYRFAQYDLFFPQCWYHSSPLQFYCPRLLHSLNHYVPPKIPALDLPKVHLSSCYFCFGLTLTPLFAVFNQFQSNGACSQTCQTAGYYLAVVQDYDCWCTNYAPSTTVSLSNCSDECPGFPDELCGSLANKLFGYIELPGYTPVSTSSSAKAASSSATPVVVVQPSTLVVTSVNTVVSTQVVSCLGFSLPHTQSGTETAPSASLLF